VKFHWIAALTLVAGVLAGCSHQNAYEKEAQKITEAVMANDMTPVTGDLAPGVQTAITRVKVAEWSEELNAQGKVKSLKETTPCAPGRHCFLAQFEKRDYIEILQLDGQDKVVTWTFHAVTAPSK
jgi:hypothetical protein